MKAFHLGLVPLASLALLGTGWARPVLVAPIHLSLPPATEGGILEFTEPRIDGDTLVVSSYFWEGGRRERVHMFERAPNGTWNYTGVFVDGRATVRLDGNLAVVSKSNGNFVFERGAQGWTQTAILDPGPMGGDHPIHVDNGAIVMHRFNPQCERADWVLRKVSGQWREVATIGAPGCGNPLQFGDVNDGRALFVHRPFDSAPHPPAEVFADTGAASWPRVGTLHPTQRHWYAQSGTISSKWAHLSSGNVYRNTGGNTWVFHAYVGGYRGVLRGNTLFSETIELDYEFPWRDDSEIPIEWHTILVHRACANGFFDYYAKLSVDFTVREWSVSDDGRRAAAIYQDTNSSGQPANQLSVFEIPDEVSFAGTQQDTFENGNFARWTPTAGSFAVSVNGATRVLRQSDLTGNAGAYLTALDWRDQSIEADLRPLEYAGNDRWFGLVARRVDDRNYYYVTFRAGGQISLRRLLDGVVTELAVGTLPPFVPFAPFSPGKNYRVRLEAVADQLAVFVDGMPRLHVKDTSLTHGHPGIAGYRTRFEVDNVIVSPATRVLVRLEPSRGLGWTDAPATATGEWSYGPEGTMRQSDSSGSARWFSPTVIGNQVVSARMRPMSYGATTGSQDPWVGIAAHVIDAQNYYYLTLRRSNQVSLRRVINGQLQVIATVPQAVTTGAWHDLRLEIIGKNIRAFVNGDLKIQTTDSTMSGGGGQALLMYKTAADTLSQVTYRP